MKSTVITALLALLISIIFGVILRFMPTEYDETFSVAFVAGLSYSLMSWKRRDCVKYM